jgi:hypothetical protein
MPTLAAKSRSDSAAIPPCLDAPTRSLEWNSCRHCEPHGVAKPVTYAQFQVYAVFATTRAHRCANRYVWIGRLHVGGASANSRATAANGSRNQTSRFAGHGRIAVSGGLALTLRGSRRDQPFGVAVRVWLAVALRLGGGISLAVRGRRTTAHGRNAQHHFAHRWTDAARRVSRRQRAVHRADAGAGG